MTERDYSDQDRQREILPRAGGEMFWEMKHPYLAFIFVRAEPTWERAKAALGEVSQTTWFSLVHVASTHRSGSRDPKEASGLWEEPRPVGGGEHG